MTRAIVTTRNHTAVERAYFLTAKMANNKPNDGRNVPWPILSYLVKRPRMQQQEYTSVGRFFIR